jgi:hypothetical protein
MKWALIIVLWSGHPIETGLAFHDLEDCFDAANKAALASTELHKKVSRDFPTFPVDQIRRYSGKDNVPTCIPTERKP